MLLVPYTEVWTRGSGLTGSLFCDYLTGAPLFGNWVSQLRRPVLVVIPWGESGESGKEGGFRDLGKANRVSGCKTLGKFEILKSLKGKPNYHHVSLVLLAMGAGHGMCGEGRDTFSGPSEGGAARSGDPGQLRPILLNLDLSSKSLPAQGTGAGMSLY